MTSRAWYVVAVAVFVVAAGCAGWILWAGISGIGDSVVRVVVPGVATLDLDHSGSYTIFHERRSVIDGRIYAEANVDGLRVTVTREAGGEPVPVTRPTATSRYSIGGHEGVSVLSFEIGEPGRYRLSAAYEDARSHGKTVLAIEHGFVARLLKTIAGTIATGLFGFAAAVVIATITFVKRRRLRRLSPPPGAARYS
jgi:hypothetical protein